MRRENTVGRFVVCAAVLAVATWVVPGIMYGSTAEVLVVALVLAAASMGMDRLLRGWLGHLGVFVTDAVLAMVVLWASQFVLPAAYVSWSGALGAGALLGAAAIVSHLWAKASRWWGV